MTKLNIKIKINEINELKPVIEYIKTLKLNDSPTLNPEIIIELGESDCLINTIQNKLPKIFMDSFSHL